MDTGFRPATDDELELVRSCGPEERCLIYEDAFFKLHVSTVASMLEAAFNNACADALTLAGARYMDRPFHADVEPLEIGQTWMRVTLTFEDGEPTADGRKQLTGDLMGVDGDQVTVDVRKHGPVTVPFAQVADAKLLMTDRLIAATAPLSMEGAEEYEAEEQD